MTNWLEEFILERRYLKNVSPKTEQYYRDSWNAFVRYAGTDQISKKALVVWVVAMRKAGVKPVSCNTFISGINAFCNWLYKNEYVKERLKVEKLKTEQTVFQPLREEFVRALVAYRPMGDRRIWTILMLLLDTGCRIDEALTLTRDRVDFENLLLTVNGKGNKQRTIPFSFELRKILFKYLRNHNFQLVFCTRNGDKLSYHNLIRDYKKLCKRLKVEKIGSFHRLRHTFALNYVRSGGGLFHLQKQLGHTTLAMTKKYTELETKDLQIAHRSLLQR